MLLAICAGILASSKPVVIARRRPYLIQGNCEIEAHHEPPASQSETARRTGDHSAFCAGTIARPRRDVDLGQRARHDTSKAPSQPSMR